MKAVIFVFFLSWLSVSCKSQDVRVDLHFDEDGTQVSDAFANVLFILGNDTVHLKVENNVLVIPKSLIRRRGQIIFKVKKYHLSFDSIPITVNELNPSWTIGVDNSPFDKERHWVIKAWEKVSIVYFFRNEDGRTFTVSNKRRREVMTN